MLLVAHMCKTPAYQLVKLLHTYMLKLCTAIINYACIIDTAAGSIPLLHCTTHIKEHIV